MYNLSPRMGQPVRYGTPDNLGPNSYIIYQSHSTKKNIAPFLSTSHREHLLNTTGHTDTVYNINGESKIKLGCSMRNKAERFVYKCDDTPGPTVYKPKVMTRKCLKLDPTPIPGKGKLYMCRVPYTVCAKGPSVPSDIDKNGYDTMWGNYLIKVPPDDCDLTLGPAFYKVPTDSEVNFKPYKGRVWSASKTKRTTFPRNNNPSPADYDVKFTCKSTDQQEQEYREMARLLTFLPRYIEYKQLQTINEDLPGPACYTIQDSSFNVKQSLSIKSVPLICGEKRFKPSVSENPAPGQYNLTDSFRQQKQFSIKRTPFGIQSKRFCRRTVERTPGAAEYQINTHTINHNAENKIKRYSTVYAPFDKLASRKIDFGDPDTYCKPGPAEYATELNSVPMPVHASIFKSTKVRFPEHKKDDISPAIYSISEPFNKLKNRKSHNKAEVPFYAKAPKCVQRINTNPGPGEYYKPTKWKNKGYYFNMSPRERHSNSDVPGPGSYTVHPAMKDSLYSAMHSHNLRLKESILRTKLRQGPKATYQDWMKDIEKNKKLRWFAQPPEFYRHCIFAL